MKSVLIILATVIFAVGAFAEETQWSTVGAKHPLWEALNVPSKTVEGTVFTTTVKEISGVECSKVELPSSNIILPSQVQYHCNFLGSMSSKDAQELFEALNVKGMDTSDAYTQVKVIGRLIVVGSDESEEGQGFARIYLNHPCQKVYSKRKARSCMKFWATKVLPNFESDNDSAVASINQKTLSFSQRAVAMLFGSESADRETLEQFEKSDYVGMMVEHIYAGRNFTYYSINKGTNVVPKEIEGFNLEDAEWHFEPRVQALSADEKKDPVAAVEAIVKDIFLGGEYPQFESFQDELEEGLVDMIEYL